MTHPVNVKLHGAAGVVVLADGHRGDGVRQADCGCCSWCHHSTIHQMHRRHAHAENLAQLWVSILDIYSGLGSLNADVMSRYSSRCNFNTYIHTIIELYWVYFKHRQSVYTDSFFRFQQYCNIKIIMRVYCEKLVQYNKGVLYNEGVLHYKGVLCKVGAVQQGGTV